MVTVYLHNGKALTIAELIEGQVDKKDVVRLTFTQKAEKKEAIGYAQTISKFTATPVIPEKINGDKGRSALSADEKTALLNKLQEGLGDAVHTVLTEIEKLTKEVNSEIKAALIDKGFDEAGVRFANYLDGAGELEKIVGKLSISAEPPEEDETEEDVPPAEAVPAEQAS